MNTYNVRIEEPIWGATHELQICLDKLGFGFAKPKIPRGSHTGEVFFFDNDQDLAYKLGKDNDIDNNSYGFKICGKYRKFYIYPNSYGFKDEDGRTTLWVFSVSNI